MKTVASKDGTPIAFDQSGQGPALILVNGASSTRRDAASLAAALVPTFTAFAYDRRGRGDSGDTAPYAVEREVEDLAALIEEAGGAAYVFGHSSGAVLALEAARMIPGKIVKLALYEPPLIIDGSRTPAPADFLPHLTELVDRGRRGDAVEYFMTFVGLPAEAIAGMRHSPSWPRMEALAHSLVYDATISADTQRGDSAVLSKWASVGVPTLVMDGTLSFGREDAHASMRSGADALAKVLPNGQRRILGGQDHGAANEVLVPALKAFFIG